jgi:hypothetical protein
MPLSSECAIKELVIRTSEIETDAGGNVDKPGNLSAH